MVTILSVINSKQRSSQDCNKALKKEKGKNLNVEQKLRDFITQPPLHPLLHEAKRSLLSVGGQFELMSRRCQMFGSFFRKYGYLNKHSPML